MTKEEFMNGWVDFLGTCKEPGIKWVKYVSKPENKDLYDIVITVSSKGREKVRKELETQLSIRNSPLMKALG